MRILLLTLAVVLVLGSCQADPRATDAANKAEAANNEAANNADEKGEQMTRETDEAEIEQLERQQIDTWGQDGDAFAATFTEDADFVDVTGGHFHGRKEIAATMTKGFKTFMAGTSMSEWKKRTVDFVTDDIAVVVTSGNCILRDGMTECRPEDLSIQTRVAVRQDGSWLFRTFQNTRINSR